MVSAGTWKGDGGAIMGVMPKSLWQKFLPADDLNRVLLAFNLLLIRTQGKNILIDTGLGNRISEKVKKIYQPSEFELPENLRKMGIERTDIDFVILTHLHFDHVGGITSVINENEELTFPNALHIIQKKEWETALNPDELNRGSYNFEDDLKLLSESGKYQLIDGDFKLLPGIKLELTGGHSEGMQMVRIESEGELAYYAGDIIPLEAHRHPAVNTAFDINRKDSFLAKKRILAELKERKGILFFAHDAQKQFLKFA